MMTYEEVLQQIEQMRTQSKANDDKRDAGLPLQIPGVKRIDDLSYGPDPKWHLLDLYLPEDINEKIPVIISIHGGGWCYGTKETYQFYGMGLAKRGFAVVNFNYRLAPEVKFPKELDDINAVFHWVVQNATNYNLDLDNVFVVGDSAGGQMAQQYVTILSNPAYRALFGYERPELTVRATALNCGVYFIDQSENQAGVGEAYFKQDDGSYPLEKLEVEKYMNQDMPPLFVMTSSHDFLHDAAFRLDGYLLAKGIDHELHVYGDEKNPRYHVFHVNQRDGIASLCNDDEVAFFKRYLNK